jgi:hypothetical protein
MALEDAARAAPAAPARRTRGRGGLPAALAPARVAVRRIVRRPARVAVVAAGVALATAALVAVSSGTLVVRERALRLALAETAPRDRAFRADELGLSSSAAPAAGRAATRALALLTPRPPVRVVELRPLRFGTHLVELTGVEGLSRWVRLDSGRLPRGCRPARCEVLVLGGGRVPRTLASPGLRLVIVGRASLATPGVLGDFAAPPGGALLAAADPAGLESLPALGSIFRTASWVVPLGPRDVHSWQVGSLLDREARAQSLLEQADPSFELTAPDDALLAGRRDGSAGTTRMLLVGGEIAAVLLGFAVLAAVGLRRSLLAEWRRLEERGARSSQLWLFLVSETGTAALAGACAGAVLGLGLAAWAAGRAGVAFGPLLRHGVLTPRTALLALAVWAAATAVLVLAVRAPRAPRAGPIRTGDVIAVAALAVALAAASRGAASADSLSAGGGSGVLLLLFPALVSLAAALLGARLLGPVLRAGERAARRGRLTLRLALIALARSPSRSAVTVAFVIVSVGLALLAASYRATLARGVGDEAAYRVPLDFTLGEGTRLVGPLDAAAPARYRALASGVGAYPVLRRSATVPGVGAAFASPLLLGLDPGALARMHGWRSDFGGPSPRRLAKLLGGSGPVRLAGTPLPPGTTGLRLASRRSGAAVVLDAVVQDASGAIERVALPAGRVSRGGRLVALELSLPPAAATALVHQQAEGATGAAAPTATVQLGPLVAYAGGRRLGVVTRWAGWGGREGARRLPGTAVRLHVDLASGRSALLRPREPTDGRALPVLVSPDVARGADGGLVALQAGDQQLEGRVVGVARRLPGTADSGGSFVVADESRLQTALDASEPGTGRPLELWLSVPARERGAVAAALRRPPFAALTVDSRAGLERALRDDPLSRSIAIALGAGALVALVLAVWGLWLTVLGDVEDERGDLHDLEAQGAGPAELRGQLRLRAAILGALGLAGGIALGAVLSAEVVRLLQVSASGAAPVPPLVRQVGWTATGAALAAAVLLGAGLVELTVRRAFREPVPG